MFCKICKYEKESKFCRRCNSDTPTHFIKELAVTLGLKNNLRNFMRSGEKIGHKPAREIEQYVRNKDKDVISEFERIRSVDKKTRVIHRLWRKVGNIFKKVHEHEK